MMLAVDSGQGIIKIGSPPQKLPGILESINVGGSLIIDNAQAQGQSGTTRTIHGWNDADVSITLALIDDVNTKIDRFACLAKIVSIFKKVTDSGTPEVYTLNHPMTSAWGVRQLLFSDLKSSESRGKKKISVTLEFVEHNSTVATSQQRKADSSAAQTQEASAAQTPELSRQQEIEAKRLERQYARV